MNEIIDKEKVSLDTKAKRVIWNMIYLLFFRLFPSKLFRLWRIFLLRLLGARISWDSEIYSSVKIWAPWNLRMEKGSCLGPHVICYNQAMVVIGENATVSQYSYICTAGHKTSERNNARSGLVVAPVIVGDNAWVGTRAYVSMGVTIGDNAIVGATASVYKDIEPGTIVGGNPAKVIKMREILLTGGGKNSLFLMFNQARCRYKNCA